MMAVFILYFFINMLVLSFFLDDILKKSFPSANVISTFNSFLLYYFLVDLFNRFQLQELPTLSVKPYLNLPIRRNQIVNYLSFVSLGTLFNLAPFILTLPFLMKVVSRQQGSPAVAGMLTAILGLTVLNHFFSLWLKRKVNLNAWWMLGFLGTLAIIACLDYYFKIISISTFSANLFYLITQNPTYSLIVLTLGLAMFFINHAYLKTNLYLDELHAATEAKKSSTEIPFLSRFGNLGDLVANELKLIFRNKRPKSALIMSFLFMFYGFMFYRNPEFASGHSAPIFCGMFMTGIFIINYGQFLFSWQSAHFDGILAHKMDVRSFFRAKFLLFALFSSVAFLLTIPYVYFGVKILVTQFIMYLWNLGVNTLIVLYFANKNYKRIDLTKSSSFNWEGVGATQWLLSIPLLVSPFILYLPFMWLGYPQLGLGLIALTAVVFIVTREYWISKLVETFNKNKYKIAEGFRNK
ncbi:MAG: hypothetical protein JWN56_453 [Sphingobacteriales bacterium]|nr:hypothetical protein [Sphingobacteriales bacterium]